MTSSSEARVLRADQAGTAYTPRTPDLRVGTWTRLGSGTVLGDPATEDTLSAIAERARATAEAQGFAVGWAKGVREAQASSEQEAADRRERDERDAVRREAEHAALVAALQAAVAELRDGATTLQTRLSAQAADLVIAVTTEVLGQVADRMTPADLVRRALEVVPEDAAAATLRLSPPVARLALEAGLPSTVTVTADPALDRADALVELHDHVLDLRVDRAVERVREALR